MPVELPLRLSQPDPRSEGALCRAAKENPANPLPTIGQLGFFQSVRYIGQGGPLTAPYICQIYAMDRKNLRLLKKLGTENVEFQWFLSIRGRSPPYFGPKTGMIAIRVRVLRGFSVLRSRFFREFSESAERNHGQKSKYAPKRAP